MLEITRCECREELRRLGMNWFERVGCLSPDGVEAVNVSMEFCVLGCKTKLRVDLTRALAVSYREVNQKWVNGV